MPSRHFRRALLGINMRKEFLTVTIPEIAGSRLAVESKELLDPRDQAFAPFQLWNLKYEQVLWTLEYHLFKPKMFFKLRSFRQYQTKINLHRLSSRQFDH